MQGTRDAKRLTFELHGHSLPHTPCGEIAIPTNPEELLRGHFDDLKHLNAAPRTQVDAEDKLQAAGAHLANQLLPEKLQRLVFDQVGKAARLWVIADELWIPWEVLAPSKGDEIGPFLGEAFAITQTRPELPEVLNLPLRRIALVVSTEAPEGARQEAEEISKLAGPGRSVELVEPRQRQVIDALAEGTYQAIHFCSHGSRVEAGSDAARNRLHLGYGLCIEAKDLAGRARKLGAASPLVFLNACHTGHTAQAISRATGWSEALADVRAGAFVIAHWAVDSESATLFSLAFYRNLFQGTPLAEAARHARVEVSKIWPKDPSRLAYSVFGHPLATCAEHLQEGPGPDSLYAESFALLRMLELHRAKTAPVTVRIDTDSEVFVHLSIGATDEIWQIVPPGSQGHEIDHLAKLRNRIEATHFGVLSPEELDTDADRLANLFDFVRHESDPEMRDELTPEFTAGIPIKELRQRLGLAAADEPLTGFEAFRLLGLPESNLRQKLLDLLRNHLDIPIHEDGSADARFAHHVGAALTALRRPTGEGVSSTRLFDLLRAARATEPASPDEQDEGLRSFLSSNVETLGDPTHGGAIALGRLFVRPRAVPRRGSSHVPSQENPPLEVDILEELNKALESGDSSFHLVLGDFGHGKTTLLRYLSADLSRSVDPSGPIPIFIPLRRHRPDASLRQVVGEILEPHIRLTDRMWSEREWILFCDGFDELNAVHQDRSDWVGSRFTSMLREAERPNVQVVLSSRPILFLDLRRRSETVERFDRWEMLPFRDDQIEAWLTNWSTSRQPIGIEDLRQRDLLDVARTPVLLFIVAQMFHQQLAGLSEPLSRAALYSQFFEWTESYGGLRDWERGGAGLREAEGKHVVPENYRQILREIAWQLFSHPDASGGFLSYEILLAELARCFPEDSHGLDERIFVAHAFREDKPKQIEFIHQSLREYLVADRLVAILQEAAETDPLTTGKLLKRILTRRPLTHAKMQFVREILEGLDSETRKGMLFVTRSLSEWPWTLHQLIADPEGNVLSLEHYRMRRGHLEFEEENAGVNTALGTLCLLSFLCFVYISDLEEQYDEDFGARLFQVLYFLSSDTPLESHLEVLQNGLSDLTWKGLSFEGVAFEEIDFSAIEWNRCRFADCLFRFGEISAAKIIGLGNDEPTFQACRFEGVDFNLTEMSDVLFRECRFEGMDPMLFHFWRNVTFERCNFEESYFTGNLHSASFEACTFGESNTALLAPNPSVIFQRCVHLTPDGWKPLSSLTELPQPSK